MTPAAAFTPIAVPGPDAARLFGLSARSWRRLNSAGLCPAPLRLNGAVRWDVAELRSWAAAGTPSRSKWEQIRGDIQ